MPTDLEYSRTSSEAECVQRVTQLAPFNEFRFDDCMAYLSSKYARPLSKYEMMKLHVMIDVHHTVARGKPVIGGRVAAFTNGPVARSAMSRVSHWLKRYEREGIQPDGFLVEEETDSFRMKPTRVPEEDDFSPAELEAMEKAWGDVIGLLEAKGFQASQDFFHKDSYVGRAWMSARRRGECLDWNEIIDGFYADQGGGEADRVKTLMRY